MAEAKAHFEGPYPKHGDFCWTEVASTDLEKCKSFYTNVFGWQFDQSRSEAGGFPYLEFASDGGTNPDGALYELDPKWFGGHTPPAHIALYVSVDDVDEAAAKAADLGGSVLQPPSDIPGVGRMCVISDPTGANVSLVTLNAQERAT